MDLELKGKRALVTGSTAGIGEAIAKRLAVEGARVVVQGRNEREAARVAAAIRAGGGEAIVALGDVGTDEGADRVVAIALRELGGVDILVNNAGAFPAKTWWSATSADWNTLYDQNVVSMARLIQRLVPAMKNAGWGRVVNIASVAGTSPMAGMPAYAATKAANLAVTVSLAREVAGTGITVNTVSPGPIRTPGAEALFREIGKQKGWADDWESIERGALQEIGQTLTGKIAGPEAIADLVAFVSSPLASAINAANLKVDGGYQATVS